MIGLLRGSIIVKKPPELLLEVGGVGYEVQAPLSTFYKLPDVGETTTLYIQFIIRENSQALYGFYTERERAVFREIIKISGVGPKLALTILSGMKIDELLECLRNGDSSKLMSMPGVGKKTAERLLIELKSKLERFLLGRERFSEIVLTTTKAGRGAEAATKIDKANLPAAATLVAVETAAGNNQDHAPVAKLATDPVIKQEQVINDAISALVALGYKEYEAKNALAKVAAKATDCESLIRLALQNIG